MLQDAHLHDCGDIEGNEGVEKEAGGSEEKALTSLPEALVWVKSQNRKGHVGAREGKACGEVFGSLLESHNLCRSTTKCLMVSLGSPPVSGVSHQEEEMR